MIFWPLATTSEHRFTHETLSSVVALVQLLKLQSLLHVLLLSPVSQFSLPHVSACSKPKLKDSVDLLPSI